MIDISIEQTEDVIPKDLLLLADPSEEMIAEYIHSGAVFAARLNTKIIGALVVLKTRPKTMEIMNISVYEEFQNKGIGRILIHKAIDYAKECKMKTLEIGTGNPGLVQMILYQKCGFRIIGVDFDYFRRYYNEKIIENGIECRDMIRMKMEF